MNKANLLIPALSVSILFGSCSAERKRKRDIDQKKTNIIYIIADDLGYGDLSCYGQRHFETPNIDRMAEEGILFTQHYAGCTVCAPSRSSLLTGQSTGHTPIRGNKEVEPEGQWPIADSTYTVAELLKDAGYVTGAFGKWGLGFPKSEGDPLNQGFDFFYGYNCQRMAHNYFPNHLWDGNNVVELKGNQEGRFGDYSADLIHERALHFIEENKDTAFFMYYPSVIPHAELLIPEQYLREYRGKFLPEKVYNGAQPGDKNFRKGAYGKQEECHAAFVAMVSLLDKQVGEVLDKLVELGIAQNTIVIFSSDNGPHQEGGADPEYFDSNGPLRGYKRDLYEGGIRIPMIAWWPNHIEASNKTDHISAFWDVMPTLAEVAGTRKPSGIDGVSFLPTMLKKSVQLEHDYLYWEFHEQGGKQAIRTGKWKLLRTNLNNSRKVKIELYDLSRDTAETTDVSKNYPEIVDQLVQLMDSSRTESTDFKFFK